MDADELYRTIGAALRTSNDASAKNNRDVTELRAMFDHLIELLVAKGVLNEGNQRLLARVGESAARAERPKVRLRVLVDKYQVPNSDIDCPSLMHLCHGRCCAFSFELSSQDLDEGVVRWELEEPYVIRHERDGYCSHIDRATLGCTIYENRPATCRGFDCRGDARVWIDFEKRIPAPMPLGLARPQK